MTVEEFLSSLQVFRRRDISASGLSQVGVFGTMLTMNDGNEREPGEVNPSVARQIDENLKRLYTEAASEELPEKLKSLLDALRRNDSETASGEK